MIFHGIINDENDNRQISAIVRITKWCKIDLIERQPFIPRVQSAYHKKKPKKTKHTLAFFAYVLAC